MLPCRIYAKLTLKFFNLLHSSGNTRTFAAVSGGVIPRNQHGTVRESLMSSLDWTPTLLEFAGISVKNQEDVTWNGFSAYDMIMHGDEYSVRDHVVFNIGLRDLESATIVYQYNNKLLKYIASDKSVEQRMFKTDFARKWCVPNTKKNAEDATYFINDAKDELMDLPNAFDGRYWLFNLDDDESENYNLLMMAGGDVDTENAIEYAKQLMLPYLDNPNWSRAMNQLFAAMHVTEEAYELFSDSFTTSFLTHHQFVRNMKNLMDEEQNENDNLLSDEFRRLYTRKWVSQRGKKAKQMLLNISVGEEGLQRVWVSNMWIFVGVIAFVSLMLILFKRHSKEMPHVLAKYGAVE